MYAPVRMGILGCARVAEYALMDILPMVPGIEVVAAASRDTAKAAVFARRHAIAKACSYEDLLADPQVEAIYLPLPNSLHREWAVRALESGKAVLCEKPLAANAVEAQLMADASQRTGLPLVEAFHWRYHPMSHRIAEIVQTGTLGDLSRVDVRFLIPEIMVPPDDIRRRFETGGGAAMDTGCYCVNFLRLLLGEPTEIISAVATLIDPEVDGIMQAELAFPGGCRGRIDASQIYAGEAIVASARILGSEGHIEINQPFLPHWGNSLEITIGGATRIESFSTTTSYAFQAQEFADVVRNKTPARTSAVDGVNNMRVIDSVYRAAGLSPRR